MSLCLNWSKGKLWSSLSAPWLWHYGEARSVRGCGGRHLIKHDPMGVAPVHADKCANCWRFFQCLHYPFVFGQSNKGCPSPLYPISGGQAPSTHRVGRTSEDLIDTSASGHFAWVAGHGVEMSRMLWWEGLCGGSWS